MLSKDYYIRCQLRREFDAESIVLGTESGYQTEGVTRNVTGVSSIDNANGNDLAFCSWEGEKGISLISHSKAGIILCPRSLKGMVTPPPFSQVVFLDNPRLVFVRFLNKVQATKRKNNVCSTASISESAEIGSNCYIGEFVKIGENCIIDDDVFIDDRVTLVQNCIVGEGSSIQAGVTIGADGFAYERLGNGELERFPHFGRVVIGKEVEICANSSIARGSLSDTVIGNGTKIDALVHIAHNVRIGEKCQLAAGTVIGGSTTIGNSCWTGLNSTLKNKINLGDNVLVGAGACVINDVPNGDIVAGIPAKSIKSKVKSKELFIMVGQNS